MSVSVVSAVAPCYGKAVQMACLTQCNACISKNLEILKTEFIVINDQAIWSRTRGYLEPDYSCIPESIALPIYDAELQMHWLILSSGADTGQSVYMVST